ncbi:MAG: hypothetical protein R3A13_00500 [Bdellovibrionota bacterium]
MTSSTSAQLDNVLADLAILQAATAQCYPRQVNFPISLDSIRNEEDQLKLKGQRLAKKIYKVLKKISDMSQPGRSKVDQEKLVLLFAQAYLHCGDNRFEVSGAILKIVKNTSFSDGVRKQAAKTLMQGVLEAINSDTQGSSVDDLKLSLFGREILAKSIEELSGFISNLSTESRDPLIVHIAESLSEFIDRSEDKKLKIICNETLKVEIGQSLTRYLANFNTQLTEFGNDTRQLRLEADYAARAIDLIKQLKPVAIPFLYVPKRLPAETSKVLSELFQRLDPASYSWPAFLSLNTSLAAIVGEYEDLSNLALTTAWARIQSDELVLSIDHESLLLRNAYFKIISNAAPAGVIKLFVDLVKQMNPIEDSEDQVSRVRGYTEKDLRVFGQAILFLGSLVGQDKSIKLAAQDLNSEADVNKLFEIYEIIKKQADTNIAVKLDKYLLKKEQLDLTLRLIAHTGELGVQKLASVLGPATGKSRTARFLVLEALSQVSISDEKLTDLIYREFKWAVIRDDNPGSLGVRIGSAAIKVFRRCNLSSDRRIKMLFELDREFYTWRKFLSKRVGIFGGVTR